MADADATAALTRTPLLEFQATSDFRFGQHNASAAATQSGRAGQRYLTSSDQFANQVLLKHPREFRVTSTAKRLPCLPPTRWRGTDYTGKRVLFLLPSQALGNNVATMLFLDAFRARRGAAAVGVFCARSTADIYLRGGGVEVFTIWIGARELKRWDVLIDLGQMEARRDVDIWPIDMETDLLALFDLAPSDRFPPTARPLPRDRPLALGVLPLASSPLRTLPASATLALVETLRPFGAVTLCLNRTQHQGVVLARALAGKLAPDVTVVDAFGSIGELLTAIEAFDYAVFADSGPAHMSKLFGTPGVAIYTSAPGDVLQGRFGNLANWTVPFRGPHCATPCGLAKLRQDRDGRIGCMGSLGVALEALPTTPRHQDPALVERLLREPVPCVAALAAAPEALAAFVRADLERRR